MTKVVVGADPFDMSALDLTDLANGTVVGSTSTQVSVVGAGSTLWFKINGTGFTTFDTNGFPTDGTVTSFVYQVPGHAATNISSFSIAATDFMGFVNAHDVSGLETALFSGNDTFIDGTGNDVLIGLGGNDGFTMTNGGNDTVQAGDGNDIINFAGTLTAADSVDGGAGTDNLVLNGDYSAGVVFGAATVTNVENIVLKAGHDYNLTLNATTNTTGQSLLVTAIAVTDTTSHVIIDGSAATGTLTLVGGAGADTLKGGAGSNTITGGDGNDTIYGGTGDNIISSGTGNSNQIIMSNWTAGDHLNGGGSEGSPGSLTFDGDFSAGVTIAGSQIVSITNLTLTAGHDYNLTLGVNQGSLDTVDGSALGAGDALTLDATAYTNVGHSLTVDGGAGDDTITGPTNTSGTIFNMSQGGDDTIISAASDTEQNTYNFGSALSAGDVIQGSGAEAFLNIDNTYANLVFNATNFTGIHELTIGNDAAGTFATSYTTNDANVAAGQVLNVAMDIAGSSFVTTFDGSAETDGSFALAANGALALHYIGGAGDDSVVISVDPTFNSGIQLDGGTGLDTLELGGGNIFVTLNAANMQNFEDLKIDGLHITTVDANVAAGHTLDVQLNHGGFNGSHETDGNFDITGFGSAIGGAGDDTISLSLSTLPASQTTFIQGNGGADLLTFTPNANTHCDFIYAAVSDSTSTTYDTVSQFDPSMDFFKLQFAVTGVDASVTTGALSTATFDSDLAAAIGSSQLAANHAVVFTPDSGTLAGDHFLIIDSNGTAGYQAGHDLVIQLTNAASLTLTTADFIT